MDKLQKFWKNILSHKILYSILALIVIIIVYFLFFNANENSITNIVKVKRGDVVSEVSVTGVVKPVKDINLAFEIPGKIKSIYVNVGDDVSVAQKLAELNNLDVTARLAQAKASYNGELAMLNKIEKGARPEEIKAKELNLKSAKDLLDKYYSDALSKIKDANIKCEDGVKNKIDALFNNNGTNSPSITYKTANFQAKIDSEFYRLKTKNALNDWEFEIYKTSSSDYERIDSLLNKSINWTNIILTLYSNLQDTLDGAIGISEATVASYKSNLNIANTNASVSLESLIASQKNIENQKIQIEIAKNNLDLIKRGYTKDEIDSQKAKVEYAKGQIKYMMAQVEKTIIRAPFSGKITKINYDEGEIIKANSPVIALIGYGKYEIETNIAESDISNVHIGDKAKVTLDAYGDSKIFEAKVIKIDIGATIIEGVATYKTTLVFRKEDKKILPGLTANLDILSSKRENVLYIPTRNIITRNGNTFVKKINSDGNIEEVKIKTGLRGSDGRTEVVDGLREEDKIFAE